MVPIQLLINVPKKKIKKAVNRNYTKRIIREAFRLNKPKIEGLLTRPIEIIIKYNKTSLPEFNKLKAELLHLLNHDSFKKNENTTKNCNLYN
jgi:ribonuclease P protein component